MNLPKRIQPALVINRVGMLAVTASLFAGCTTISLSSADPEPSRAPVAAVTPLVVYVTPPPAQPTPLIIYVTPEPAPTFVLPSPKPVTPSPTVRPPTLPPPAANDFPTAAEWKQLNKNEEDYAGESYRLYGCIWSWDDDTHFLAQASYQPETYWFLDGETAYFSNALSAPDGIFADFREDDVVLMDVFAFAPYKISYFEKMMWFTVTHIEHAGSCAN